MVYDVDMHIPRLVDQLLPMINNFLVTGEHVYLSHSEKTLDTIIELEKNNGFKSDIKEYMCDYETRVKDIKNGSLDKIKVVKTIEDGIRVVDECMHLVNDATFDYWKIIRDYVITYYSNVE